MSNTAWTPEEDATMTRLWAEGYTSNQIEARMTGRTRSAVCGRLNRLGNLKGSLNQKSSPPVSGKRKKGLTPRPKRVVQACQPKAVIAPPPPPGDRLTFAQLEAMSCRYGYGDPRHADFRFCGGPAIKPYGFCLHHAEICHTTRPSAGTGWGKLQHMGGKGK